MAIVRSRADDFARIRYVLAPALPALAAGLLALALLFRVEILAAIGVWYSSTAYSHCFFVLPIVAWLAWDRRDRVFALRARPAPWAAVLALFPVIAWLAAERLGIMEGRQLAVVGFVWVLFLATLGWTLFRALLGPLLYLVFLVPFGGFVTGPLQNFTTGFTGVGLDILGIPNDIDAYLIRIPEGAFYVAQACAGLRFLIASIAFGALYGLLMYRSNVKRGLFLLMSLVVPVVANGFRALGIVALGHYIGSAQAVATDHVLYGWVFFSIVILIEILVGLPFRDDLEPRPRTMPPPAPGEAGARPALVACAAALAAVVLAPLAGHALDLRGTGQAPAIALRLRLPPGCETADTGTTGAGTTGGGTTGGGTTAPGRIVQDLVCDGQNVTVTVRAIPAGASPATVIRTLDALAGGGSGGDEDRIIPLSFRDTRPREWTVVADDQAQSLTTGALWVNNEVVGAGLRTRIALARANLFGGGTPSVIVAFSVTPGVPWRTAEDAKRSQQALETLIGAQQRMNERIAGLPGWAGG
jgi:exosortase A